MTTNWFEACTTCDTPDSCYAFLYSVVCENRGMKALYSMDEEDCGSDSELMMQAGSLVTEAALDVVVRLRQQNCGYDGPTIQQMITRGIDGGY